MSDDIAEAVRSELPTTRHRRLEREAWDSACRLMRAAGEDPAEVVREAAESLDEWASSGLAAHEAPCPGPEYEL